MRYKQVCVKCGRVMRTIKNGVSVIVLFGENEPYEIWNADKKRCPECGNEVVAGFANEPFAAHYWEDDFAEQLAEARRDPDHVIVKEG